MTPPAATVAGRSAGKQRAAGSGAGAGNSRAAGSGAGGPPPRGHRRGLRKQAGPKAPRRVSGPIGGVVAVPPREEIAPARPPARTPQPVRAPAPTRTTQQPRPQQEQRTRRRQEQQRTRTARPRPARGRTTRQRTAAKPLGARAVHALRTLPDHRLLDRLIRGRAWIPLLGVMLAGIVAMQVEVLKLGASIGRSIERTSTLQTRNDTLRQEVASLDNDARIESLATKQGMVMPAAGNVGFLSAGDGAAAVGKAVGNIHVPDATGFLALASANGTIATTSNSSTTGLAGLATISSTLASTLAQSASQTPSAAQTPTSQGTTPPTTSTPSSTATTTGATAPTSAQTQPASAQTQPASTAGSSPTGTPSQSSSTSGTLVSTPTPSTSSGASGSGGASLGG